MAKDTIARKASRPSPFFQWLPPSPPLPLPLRPPCGRSDASGEARPGSAALETTTTVASAIGAVSAAYSGPAASGAAPRPGAAPPGAWGPGFAVMSQRGGGGWAMGPVFRQPGGGRVARGALGSSCSLNGGGWWAGQPARGVRMGGGPGARGKALPIPAAVASSPFCGLGGGEARFPLPLPLATLPRASAVKRFLGGIPALRLRGLALCAGGRLLMR